MANQVILKKSSVAARVPVAGDLAFGELALNYQDGLLYYKKADSTVSTIGAGTGGGATTLSALTDVNSGLSTPVDGQMLVWNAALSKWIRGYLAPNNVTRNYTGTGSLAAFTITTGLSVDSVIVTENGLIQTPTTDYTISGTTLTFVTAPAVGTKIQIRELGSKILSLFTTVISAILLVGGGASGASSGNGGSPGGGAGGLIYKAGNSFDTGVLYTVTIGAGGAGGPQLTSNPGNSSTITGTNVSLTALYGGAHTKSSPFVTNGLPGGSGGGAPSGSTGGAGIQPQQSGDSGAFGFGNAGANGGPGDIGGGGGGAGAAATSSTGGAGLSYDISGTSQFYAGGGGGSSYSGAGQGSGGSSIGGSAVSGQSRDAVVNTGSGAAGIWGNSGSSGSGSSGICIFKYADSYPAATTTGAPTITVAGGFRIYKFTGSGSITFNG